MIENLGKLREIKNSEIGIMLDWRNDESVSKNMYKRHKITIEEHMAWWKKIKNSNNDQYLMYEYNGRPSGIVAFNKINRQNENSSWAFYASPDSIGGVGAKMEYLALEYGFQTMQLKKLYCEVLETNKTVIKMHGKFGFKIEGVLRRQYKIDNKFIDIICMGLLEEEWLNKKSEIISIISRSK